MKKPLATSAAVVVLAFAMTACATKRYGRAVDVTGAESAAYTCQDVELELAKARGFLDQVNRDSQFSGADVLAFLGDFGIGNSLEKSAALESGNERIAQLNALAAEKCTAAEPTITPSSSVTLIERPAALPPSRLIIGTAPELPATAVSAPTTGGDPIGDLQAALASRGFYAGPITGTLDVDTLTAISDFQKSIGLPPTGFAGPTTVKALGL